MQIINKKCPYCSAIFKVKSALESHLQTKHPEKQMINIDSIPEIKYPTSKDTVMELATSSHNIVPPSMSVDYWKTKLGLGLHPLAVQQHNNTTKPSRKKLSDFSESEISFTDSNNDEQPDDYELENFNDDSNQIDELKSNNDNVQRKNNKRHRTHVNRVQKSILRKIFEDVKSPSMIDCENIGHEIGLFKRVVQVSRKISCENSTISDVFVKSCPNRFGSKMHVQITKNAINYPPMN